MPMLDTSVLLLALFGVGGYLLGAVPFGLVMARLFGLGDLRKIGSGNIGATNVLRTGNKLAAFLTLVLDAGKGGIAVLIARALAGEDAAQIAGGAAFLGHLFPVYLGFKGGKGVATFLGTILALAWPVGIAACATWAAVAAALRYSSLSALAAAALTPVWAIVLNRAEVVLLTAVLAVLIFIRHHANIRRLLAGTEPKIGRKTG
ncbi:acyl-phosphate glycerol 3-phosphate acyltransferase [Rhodovulum sulfidophilum]|uniref:Glycerol-3-phosphate acyltransferase n=1 Tax=Rhodovulum visakhapatnamense TaxID=364297 RepID=A0A4V3GTV8_9RHOB|nr:glycerol-3-phosphate 1-O-acyltransferase PlsY [Rhodovulum visakhapatnamense]MBL3569208.1 glycerol-3-phosphate 1-O-acyltransferase PlsY [Rhodovulum visakhapatnamense]MBL3578676.1 glycerol-3-phosphate 1-O-acyltransferase PlsY [Rhodovulum visakhapatnamense]OLS44388.1 acyl-phosphate glycerol 3-phosphate acyltransferase [Rhodovulum sulfidophilum]TDX27783.1 acyl-phosphate glycerol-3-phosphate acyltransferase [Rhodovulum visakhapatnamense]